MGVVDRVSLRSRRRKLGCSSTSCGRRPETTVVDVGVDDAPLRRAADGLRHAQLLRGALPLAGADHRARPARAATASARASRRCRTSRATRCELPFADGAFDVGFSNAVIEHVGGRERQRRSSPRRSASRRRVFVTTPNRWFPVELHTRLPFVHWLPERRAHRAYELAAQAHRRTSSTCSARASCGALFPPGAHRQPRHDACRDRVRTLGSRSLAFAGRCSSSGSRCTTS